MTGPELLGVGFFVALVASQPLTYLLIRGVEHTEGQDRARSRTPGGSTDAGSATPSASPAPVGGASRALRSQAPPTPDSLLSPQTPAGTSTGSPQPVRACRAETSVGDECSAPSPADLHAGRRP